MKYHQSTDGFSGCFMKYHYDDNFLIGTYAFVRQLALSIEHASADWEFLSRYMASRKMLQTITPLIDMRALAHPPLNRSLRAKLISLIFNKGYLTLDELARLMVTVNCAKLLIYHKNPKEIEIYNMVKALHEISITIRGRVFKIDKRLKMADQVEHFNQSNHGIFYSVEDIIPFDSFEIKKTSKRR